MGCDSIPLSTKLAVAASAVFLTGCFQKLPPCIKSDPDSQRLVPALQPAPSKDLLIGIDGSGSMLGHARATNPSGWESLLKAINLSSETLGLQAKPFRIGGGEAKPLTTSSVTPATNPCFFTGCAPFQPPIPSSLQALWQIPQLGKTLPLRVLISDLEVNDSDITNLTRAFNNDFSKGASVGVLALKLPFDGVVYDSKSRPIYTGSLRRPLYLLASGPADQVKSLLERIRTNMAQMGVQSQEISILGGSSRGSTLQSRNASVIPPDKGSVGVSLRFSQVSYSSGANPGYSFIRLKPGAVGFSVATVKPWIGGTIRPDLGLVRLERIPLAPGDSTSPVSLKLNQMLVAGSDVRLDFDVTPTTLAGAYRATIDVLPEQWWIDWDRGDRIKNEGQPLQKAEKTDGLLLLLNTLDFKIREGRRAPPAATLCFIFQSSP